MDGKRERDLELVVWESKKGCLIGWQATGRAIRGRTLASTTTGAIWMQTTTRWWWLVVESEAMLSSAVEVGGSEASDAHWEIVGGARLPFAACLRAPFTFPHSKSISFPFFSSLSYSLLFLFFLFFSVRLRNCFVSFFHFDFFVACALYIFVCKDRKQTKERKGAQWRFRIMK